MQEWFVRVAREALGAEGRWTAEASALLTDAAAQIDLAEASAQRAQGPKAHPNLQQQKRCPSVFAFLLHGF